VIGLPGLINICLPESAEPATGAKGLGYPDMPEKSPRCGAFIKKAV
jgi:hypothetical protein